jgi:ribonuclease HI
MAVLRCAELLLNKSLMRRKIHICSDSTAVLTAVVKTTTKSSLVWECMQVSGKLIELNKVTLVSISRHQGILGNEKAYRLAKEGATEVPYNQYTTMPFSVGKELIKNQSEPQYQARWAACTGC